ncbi:MAG: 3-oxoacyl-ACP reductase FabG [Chloroflexi bacterium]|nr:3-oxoacyl-ACP reductase FabG [Chloroflexota bacterium]
MKLQNKVALVTGGSSGIGKAITLLFAREGADLVINYAHSDREAGEVADQVRALGRRALAIRADVSDVSEVRAMVDRALADLRRVDILVNNAGITIRALLWELTEEKWDRVVDVNMKGTFLCSKAVSEVMVREGGGRIVNIASIRGIEGSNSSMHYAAAKAGVIALTKSLARELAPLVRVNAVAPGYVESALHAGMSPDARQAVIESTPLKRFGRPEDVARAVLFFASDDSDFITGQTLVVDGGRVMR